MDDMSYNIRVPKKWARIAMIVGVTALIVAPLTAVAGHVFDDVPGSHTFHNDITWLADAGVTKGCNPPTNDEFCPDDNVTRGQMAAFIRRFAQYIDAEDGTPGQADNADQLDGRDSSEIMSQMWASNDSNGDGRSVADIASTDLLEINSITLDAPADGFLIISGNVFVNPLTDTTYVMQPLLDGNAVVPGPDIGESGWPVLFESSPDGHLFSLAYTVTAAVTEGTHTVSQEVGPFVGTADFFFNKQTLTAQFVPAGTIETAPTGAGASGGSGAGQ